MRRITLTERWNCLKSQAKIIGESHLNEFFKDKEKPTHLFKVDRIGEVKSLNIIGFHVVYVDENNRRICEPYIYEGKNPTRLLVSELECYIETIKNANRQFFVDYKDIGTTACNYDEILPVKWLAFSATDLDETAKQNRELYAPREGYQACTYCGIQTPINEMIEETIIGRGRNSVWNSRKGKFEYKACITKEKMKFCSGKCAGNEQMSREG